MLAVPSRDDSPALMARVAAGDRAAFALLARRLHSAGQRVAIKVLGDASEAEDAMQAALVKLWTRAATFDPARGTVSAWFNRTVVNACLDRRRLMRPVVPLDAVAEAACPDPTPAAAAEAADDAGRLASAVARLSPRQRAAIVLFYGEEATAAEVADALDTTPKAIEGLLARARSDLRRILSEMDEDR